MAIAAGQKIRATMLGVPVTPTTSSLAGTVTSGATEVRDAVLGDYQFTAIANTRYLVVYAGCRLSGSVANDLYEIRIRNGGASSPTTASTLVVAHAKLTSVTGGPGQETSDVFGTFVPGAGTVTLSAFTVRTSGTGVGTPTASRELYVIPLG